MIEDILKDILHELKEIKLKMYCPCERCGMYRYPTFTTPSNWIESTDNHIPYQWTTVSEG